MPNQSRQISTPSQNQSMINLTIFLCLFIIHIHQSKSLFWYLPFNRTIGDPFAMDLNNDSMRDFDCRYTNQCRFPLSDINATGGFLSLNQCFASPCRSSNQLDTFPRYYFQEKFFVNITMQVTQTDTAKDLLFFSNFGYSNDHVLNEQYSGTSMSYSMNFYANASGQVAQIKWPSACVGNTSYNSWPRNVSLLLIPTSQPFKMVIVNDPPQEKSMFQFFYGAGFSQVVTFEIVNLRCRANIVEAQSLWWAFNGLFANGAKIFELHIADSRTPFTSLPTTTTTTTTTTPSTMTTTTTTTTPSTMMTSATTSSSASSKSSPTTTTNYSIPSIDSNSSTVAVADGVIDVNTALIVAGAILLVIILCIIVVIVCILRRRRRQRADDATHNALQTQYSSRSLVDVPTPPHSEYSKVGSVVGGAEMHSFHQQTTHTTHYSPIPGREHD